MPSAIPSTNSREKVVAEPADGRMRGDVVAFNTIAFSVAFAAWVMFAPSVRLIAEEFGLSPSQATFIKSVPILTGSLFRIPVGMLTDRIGARVTFTGLMVLGAVAAFAMASFSTAPAFIAGGLVLGMVGTTFVVGVQSVSSWTPQSRQGLALGLFGAGNVGTAITTLGMPILLVAFDWQMTFRVYSAVLLLTAVAYWLLVRDAPRVGAHPTLSALLEPVRTVEAWLYGLYYTATFGVFVAATLLLGDIYIDIYDVSLETAGVIATSFTFTASLARIPGGALADRFGAQRLLVVSLPAIGCTLVPVVFGLPLVATAGLVFVSGVFMGFGMAATFKAIPTQFPKRVGAVGGLVGAVGGLGGFYLPLVGDWVATAVGSTAWQIAPLAGVAFVAAGAAILSGRLVRAYP